MKIETEERRTQQIIDNDILHGPAFELESKQLGLDKVKDPRQKQEELKEEESIQFSKKELDLIEK